MTNSYYYIELFKLKLVLQVNIIILVILFVISIVYHFRLVVKEKKDDQRLKKLNQIFSECLQQKPSFTKKLFPKAYLKVEYFLPVLEKYQELFFGDYWEKFKEFIIHNLLEKNIQKNLISRSWQKRGIAIRTLIISPSTDNEKYIEVLLRDKIPLIRFNAAICALKIKTERLINKVLEALSQEDAAKRYPYRDALINSDHFVHKTIAQRLKIEKDPKVRIAALQILSLKIGYVTLDMIEEDLQAEDASRRWWAVKALENVPSKETVEILIKMADDPVWQVQAAVLGILGKMHDKQALDTLIRKIHDPVLWVRLHAALSLKEIGEEGIEILENLDPEKDKNAYEIASYVLSLPPFHLEEWRNKWPDFN
ncbi:MAG: hypothetical protein Tsb0015_05770 [Simkaniaceae bacterium]